MMQRPIFFVKLMLVMVNCLFSTQSFADFSKLLKELNEKNDVIIRSKLQVEMVKLERDDLKANRSWNTIGQINHRDVKQEGVSLLDANTTLTDSLNLGFDKLFITGTKTSFKHQINYVDRSRWNPLVIGNGSKLLYTTSNTFTLEQEIGKNIFGKVDRLDLSNAHLKVKNMEQKTQWDIEKVQQDFYVAYVNTQYHHAQLELKKRALERVIKRKEMVESRVKGGLRENVDLMESMSNVLTQKEGILNLEQTIKTDLLNLGFYLHRSVSKNEIESLELNKLKKIPHFSGDVKANKELIKLENDLQLLYETKKRVQLDFMPQIQLQGEYVGIKNNHDFIASFEKAVPGFSPFRQFRVGLQVSMPLDFPKAKVDRSKINVQILTKQTELEKRRKNIDVGIDTIKEKLELLTQSFELSQQRLKLANDVLKEQYRLYNMAARDLDTVINAEVALIATEESIVNYVYSFEMELVKYSFSIGALQDFFQFK